MRATSPRPCARDNAKSIHLRKDAKRDAFSATQASPVLVAGFVSVSGFLLGAFDFQRDTDTSAPCALRENRTHPSQMQFHFVLLLLLLAAVGIEPGSLAQQRDALPTEPLGRRRAAAVAYLE